MIRPMGPWVEVHPWSGACFLGLSPKSGLACCVCHGEQLRARFVKATRDTLVQEVPRMPWEGCPMVALALGCADPLFRRPMEVKAFVPVPGKVKQPRAT